MALDSINGSASPLLPKANDTNASGSAGALAAAAKEGRGAGVKTAVASPSVDQASFSAAASALSSANSGAPVDMKKIEAIRAQIQNGTYQIDSQRIAGKMLEEATQFGRRA